VKNKCWGATLAPHTPRTTYDRYDPLMSM
jgi:hypothetical protein